MKPHRLLSLLVVLLGTPIASAEVIRVVNPQPRRLAQLCEELLTAQPALRDLASQFQCYEQAGQVELHAADGVDLSSLDAVVSAHVPAAVWPPATAFQTEVLTNDLCTATLDELVTRINGERDAIQTDIDAASNLAQAKVAMTTMNTRMAAALRKVAKCVRGRAN